MCSKEEEIKAIKQQKERILSENKKRRTKIAFCEQIFRFFISWKSYFLLHSDVCEFEVLRESLANFWCLKINWNGLLEISKKNEVSLS